MYRGKKARKDAAAAAAAVDSSHNDEYSKPVKPSTSSSSLASLASRRLSEASTAGTEQIRRVVARTTTTLLLSIDKIPTWYGENPYIRTGYRPVFAAAAPCFRSWTYLHNQSGNIYTHLIPGVAATLGNAALAWYLSAYYPGATLADRAVFHVYLTACTACFGLSAAYHTLLCHSEELADLWIRLDYVGISLLIMASFVPGLYMGFYCEPGLLAGYLAAVSVILARVGSRQRCGGLT